MWSVLHWIFLYCLNPNPCMHIISSFALSILSAKTDDDFKKKDIVPALSLFFMYCAKNFFYKFKKKDIVRQQ